MTTVPSTTTTFDHTPLLFKPEFEQLEIDEEKTTAELIETMQKISAITSKDYGRCVRSVHAKSHGLLYGTLSVKAELPPGLAQGMFAHPGDFPIAIRLSTIPGDILDDQVSTPRGMAIKVVGVPGERLPGASADVTQDFVLVNSPAFLKPDAKSFLNSVKLLAATTDKVEGIKKAVSAVLRGTEKLIENFGGESPTLVSLGGHPETNILGETFYSQAPILYGQYFGKICVTPVSPELTALTDAPVDLEDKPNGLREAVVSHFTSHGGMWEIRVQLCTNLATMPVEDASVVWPEEESPYRVVGHIRVDPQAAWDADRIAAIDAGMSFDVWHCLAAHRPLGSIMRVRKAVYETMSVARRHANGMASTEPTALNPSQKNA